MAGMAGKSYNAANKDRLKAIPLGSGNVYMIPYVEGSSMPTDAAFEQNTNMIGRTKNGATFNYTQSYYTAVSDDGVAKKRRLNEETASFTWGIMTWVPETIAKLLRTATASTASEGDYTISVLEGGGIGNQVPKKYWLHFVGGDDIDGKITLTGLGENIDALSAAFANDNETVLQPNFEFDPYDAAGHLYKFKMANQPNVTAEAGTPSLSALSIGSLTLDPTFDKDINNYATETENNSDTVTATAGEDVDVVITVNGNSITNGTAPTWAAGDNIVSVQLTSSTGMNTYTVTVTKS
jgi:hypothetical protein